MGDVGAHEAEVRALYRRLLDAWNGTSADDFAAPFAEDGVVVGFDRNPRGEVRGVRSLGIGAAVLHAVAGMVPAGRSDIEPALNAVQTLVAEERDGEWRVVSYQNTPAQLHGRPDQAERLTEELRAELRAGS